MKTLFLALIMGCWSLGAHAGDLLCVALLDGSQEVGPVTTDAAGAAFLEVDEFTGDFAMSGFFQDLGSDPAAAHIHGPAGPGENAGVLFGLTISPDVSTPSLSDYTLSGSGNFTSAQIDFLKAGSLYINVHSQNHPTGEIRGQFFCVPVPDAGGTGVLLGLSSLGLLFVCRSRRVVDFAPEQ